MSDSRGAFEILEHTADVGVAARGDTLEEVFVQAALGLCEIAGIWSPGPHGERVSIEVEADDLGALLVDWLSEILFLHDVRDAAIAALDGVRVGDGSARGTVGLKPLDPSREGVQVKAVTYHQLSVSREDGSWRATVFFDI